MVAGGRELIDTLWNVNICRQQIVPGLSNELIDTLWNVNESEEMPEWAKKLRINRYIMECKCFTIK